MRLRELIPLSLPQTSSSLGDVGLPSVQSNLMAAPKFFSRKLRCALSVKSRHLRRRKSCPLYPQEQTLALLKSMSARAKNRTPSLLDHFVGEQQERFRD